MEAVSEIETIKEIVWARLEEKTGSFVFVLSFHARKKYGVDIKELFMKNQRRFMVIVQDLMGDLVCSLLIKVLLDICLELHLDPEKVVSGPLLKVESEKASGPIYTEK